MVTPERVQAPFRFLDRHGFSWTVLELRSHEVGGAGSLYFFSGGSTLRLSAYPDDWADMDWAALDRLRVRAEVLSEDVTRGGMRSRLTPAEGLSPA